MSWGLDDGWGNAVFFPGNFAASMVFNTAIILIAVCAQDVLTSELDYLR